MDLSRSTPSIATVVSGLRCFNYVAETMSIERKELSGSFDALIIYWQRLLCCPVQIGLDPDFRPVGHDPGSPGSPFKAALAR